MRRKVMVAVVLSVLLEALVVGSRRGRFLAVDTVVRCRRGHLYTTMWVPGGSFKALRLGWWRYQRCPVGNHWALVTPARVSDLTAGQLRAAASIHDLHIP